MCRQVLLETDIMRSQKSVKERNKKELTSRSLLLELPLPLSTVDMIKPQDHSRKKQVIN